MAIININNKDIKNICAGLFEYISFRAAMALITSLVVSLLFGGRIINFIRNKQIGEQVRELGLQGEESKKGTPTMGGLIIISAIIIPTLLFAQLNNIYVIILLISTVWLGSRFYRRLYQGV